VIRLSAIEERWELIEAFATARDSITHVPVITVTLHDTAGHSGRGEAAGVDYDGETPASMLEQLASLGDALADDIDHNALLARLSAGGARNALDCALWDLRAKQRRLPAWQLAHLPPLAPVTTVLTLGLADDADIRRKARAARRYPILKLKLDRERHLDVIRIVREEHPDARLIVDANEGWSRSLLDQLLPSLVAHRIELIEQPVPRGQDDTLAGYRGSIPLAADESCTDHHSLAALIPHYRYINIKLDKTGGLTEALTLADRARRQGVGLMVGNMCGTSLAMAPAFLIAQSCKYVDLDGPLLQKLDRDEPMRFEAGRLHPPAPALWG
jgi:L-alanine-DL-glutamate epimerase-like enolase superfamily enzyme